MAEITDTPSGYGKTEVSFVDAGLHGIDAVVTLKSYSKGILSASGTITVIGDDYRGEQVTETLTVDEVLFNGDARSEGESHVVNLHLYDIESGPEVLYGEVTWSLCSSYAIDFSIFRKIDFAPPIRPGSSVSGSAHNLTWGSSVSGVATVGIHARFSMWVDLDNGYQVMSDNPTLIVQVDDTFGFGTKGLYPRLMTRHFAALIEEAVKVIASVSTDGSGTVESEYCYPGESCTLTAVSNVGYRFVRWVLPRGGVVTVKNLVVSVPSDYSGLADYLAGTAEFEPVPDKTVTTSVDHLGWGTTSGDGTYRYGETCTVTVTKARQEYVFVGWFVNGECVSTNESYSFAVLEDVHLVAKLSVRHTVTTSSDPSNGGTTTGDGEYLDGETCIVTASPAVGYDFDHWTNSDGGRSIESFVSFTVGSDIHWTAHFVASDKYFIVVNLEIDPQDAADDGCTAAATVSPQEGSYSGQIASVTYQANAAPGWKFSNWYDGSTQNPIVRQETFGPDHVKTLLRTAYFERDPIYTVSTRVSPINAGTSSGDGQYRSEDTCTISTSPRCSPWTFDHWLITMSGLTFIVRQRTYSFNPTGNAVCVAYYSHTWSGNPYDHNGNILCDHNGNILYDGDLVTA